MCLAGSLQDDYPLCVSSHTLIFLLSSLLRDVCTVVPDALRILSVPLGVRWMMGGYSHARWPNKQPHTPTHSCPKSEPYKIFSYPVYTYQHLVENRMFTASY